MHTARLPRTVNQGVLNPSVSTGESDDRKPDPSQRHGTHRHVVDAGHLGAHPPRHHVGVSSLCLVSFTQKEKWFAVTVVFSVGALRNLVLGGLRIVIVQRASVSWTSFTQEQKLDLFKFVHPHT